MKEYVVVIVSLGFFLVFLILNKYKTPKYRFLFSLIGIIAFIALFIYEVVTKKVLSDDWVSFLLIASLIIYLGSQALKNYRQLTPK